MQLLFSYTARLTTDTGGDATAYAGGVIQGKILAIKYEPGTIEGTCTLTITGNTSGVAILTKASPGTSTVWFYPRAIPSKVSDGSAFTDVAEPVHLFSERIKVVVSSGGDTKTGTITFYTAEEQ